MVFYLSQEMNYFLGGYFMKEVRCRYCGFTCYKYGKTRAGTQRWKCRECGNVFTLPINRDAKDFSMFLDWLFSKDTQKDMTGEGRNFRRKTAKFWDIWANTAED